MIDTITYALLKKHVEEKIAALGTVLRYAGAVDTIPEDLSNYQPGDVIINIDNGIEYIIYIKDGKKVIEELGDGFGIATLTLDLNNHKTDISNPHNVTATQTGAYTIAQTDNLLDNKLDKTGGTINGNLQINGKEIIQQTRELDANEVLITDANAPIEANYYSKWNSGSEIPVTMINTETERGYITAPVETNKYYLVVGKFQINSFSQNSVKLGALGRTSNSSDFYFSNYMENIISLIATNQTYTICYCINSGNKTGLGFGFINTITSSSVNITLTEFKVYPLMSVPSNKIKGATQLQLNKFIKTENLFSNGKTNCVFTDNANNISYIYGITGTGATFTYLSDVEIKIEEGQIKGIIDPTNDNDAATKKYVDGLKNIILDLVAKIRDIETELGDISTTLDNIIALQNSYINGGSN